MIWAKRSLDLITIGSAVYCNVLSSVGQNKHGNLVTCLFRWQYLVKILIWVIYTRLEYVIAKYSTLVRWLTATHTHQNIRLIRAGAMAEHNPHKKDNSAHSCNSRFSNRDGDKEAKLMDYSFNIEASYFNCSNNISQYYSSTVFLIK